MLATSSNVLRPQAVSMCLAAHHHLQATHGIGDINAARPSTRLPMGNFTSHMVQPSTIRRRSLEGRAPAGRAKDGAVVPAPSNRQAGTVVSVAAAAGGHSEDLIFELFPPRVAAALMAGQAVEPERYECVSIFFSDIVGYTDLCSQLAPHQVMDLLDRCVLSGCPG